MADCIERFFRSYARIDPGFSRETLQQITPDVIQTNLPLLGPDEDLTINDYISRGSMAVRNGRTPTGTVASFCQPVAFASFARFYTTGAPAVVPATRRTPPQCVSPKANVSNKMNHFVAELEAKASNPEAYAIMLELDGNITEGSSGYLFLRPGRQGAASDDLTPEEADLAEALGEEWLARGAERSGRLQVKQAAARELAYMRGQIGTQEQGVRRVARHVARSLARLPWFARLGIGFAERLVSRALCASI